MKTLQHAYAGKPVRFLLFPCNQFANQEPDSNSKIKKFAEQYVSLAQGNVLLFAKSNLNHVACTYSGADACMPGTTMCCPPNDAVYNVLLSYPLKCLTCTESMPHSPIGWNFNKIFVDQQGKPWTDEILPADDFELAPYIDRMLAGTTPDALAGRAKKASAEYDRMWLSSVCLGGLFLTGFVMASAALRVNKLRVACSRDGPYFLHVGE
uniref:Glutathione peroxidase n=1 Tax=Pyrodinium bahamense TaxID=73915 RepID=A0A7S0FXZ6_9DINO|mmetsp:Transcript_52439/g.145358  ORF Transcript_52439/g.145358 Transcript_52439/m.145358 type:complete len:209 (+) Transcript_52439:276-902(+)